MSRTLARDRSKKHNPFSGGIPIMSDPKNPVPGDLVIDASDVAVVDITPEQIVKLIKLHEGAEKALANIERLKPNEIKRAGLNPAEVDRAITLIAEYRRTEALLPAAEKLVELLTETRFDRGHQISLLLAEIATQARRRGQRDPQGAEILGPFADLFEYQYGPANKAVATREKAKANAAKANAAPEMGGAPPVR
jgi:hypothetical protein